VLGGHSHEFPPISIWYLEPVLGFRTVPAEARSREHVAAQTGGNTVEQSGPASVGQERTVWSSARARAGERRLAVNCVCVQELSIGWACAACRGGGGCCCLRLERREGWCCCWDLVIR
jgi:hypothetical protein